MALTRGRVVPGAGARPALAAAPSPVVRREALEAVEQARALLERARAEAAEARRQAEAEAGALRAGALREGQQAAEAAAAARWAALKDAEARWLAEREGDLIAVARMLAERLLLRALDLSPDTILDLTRQALQPLRRARQIQLFVHPDDAAALRAGIGALGRDPDEVHLDSNAPRGAVRVVSELGTIRAELAPQLDRLLAALRSP